MAPSSSCSLGSSAVPDPEPLPSALFQGGGKGVQVCGSPTGAVFCLPLAFPPGCCGFCRAGDLDGLRLAFEGCQFHPSPLAWPVYCRSATCCQWAPHHGQCTAMALFMTRQVVHLHP